MNSADELNEEDEDVFSISHISTFRAAIVDLYRKQSKRLEPELDKELKNILDGYKKIINKLKQRGLMKLHEGKREIYQLPYLSTSSARTIIMYCTSFSIILLSL